MQFSRTKEELNVCLSFSFWNFNCSDNAEWVILNFDKSNDYNLFWNNFNELFLFTSIWARQTFDSELVPPHIEISSNSRAKVIKIMYSFFEWSKISLKSRYLILDGFCSEGKEEKKPTENESKLSKQNSWFLFISIESNENFKNLA